MRKASKRSVPLISFVEVNTKSLRDEKISSVSVRIWQRQEDTGSPVPAKKYMSGG